MTPRTTLAAGDAPVPLRALLAACDDGGAVALTEAARVRVAAARAVVNRYAAGPEPVYGLHTGLGGNLRHRVDPAGTAAEVQVIRGRAIGMGPPLPEAVARASLLCRIIGLAQGGAGISPSVLDLLVAMFNRGVTPVIPSRGSIGAGDLGLCAHIGAVVIGRGEAWHGGRRLPGAAALAAAGLQPAILAPKDGLGLINSSAVSCGHAARVLASLADGLVATAATVALAMEGYGANPAILDPRIAAARPAAGQVRASALFRRLLDGSFLYDGIARSIQDALCFRVMAPVAGPVLAAFEAAAEQVEIEVNSAADNPLVLPKGEPGGEFGDGLILSTANFHTPAIALAFDALAVALSHAAAACMQRTIKLMAPDLSGLPRYLSPVGGASAGLNPLQKTAAALYAEIRLRAVPASLDSVPVSDWVEDHAPNTPLAIRKLEEQLVPFRMLVAIEALAAAQAADLRGGRLAPATAALHRAIRARVPPLDEDRETGRDADAVHGALAAPELMSELRGHLAGLGLHPLMAP